MNEAHLHLVLVHIPIALVPAATLILALAIWRENHTLRQTALIGMIGCAIFAVFAYLTGEGAEELVEHLNGVVESRIEDHESAATAALWMSVILGLSSLASLFGLHRGLTFAKHLVAGTFLIALATTAALAYTGQQGGKIRHPEAFATTNTTAGEMNENTEAEGDED